ncbi:GIY-YIG nuclease family protein [Escherichia coli]
MNRLLEIGFIKVGYWELHDGKLSYSLDASFSDVTNNLYAFICDGEVKYVGKTTRLLKKRMYHYANPGESQSTNIKNNAKILQHLQNNEAVDILVLPDNGLMHYGQFHLNLAAGLEDDIIRVIKPDWNGFQERTIIYEAIVEPNILESTKYFQFNMTPTYWNKGFFNVSVGSSESFGEDGQILTITDTNKNVTITAIINRTANSNKTPRIMGGVDLRKYFQSKFNVGDIVNYRMLSKTNMVISC